MARRPLAWLHGEIKTPPFSKEARIEAGTLLRRLQEGESLGLPHSRPMPKHKQKLLEKAGFRFGDAEDFLGLTSEERRLVELRLAVSHTVRRLRQKRRLTQHQLAAKVGSSQSRVAKLEAGASDVSLDFLFRNLFAVGGKLQDLLAERARK